METFDTSCNITYAAEAIIANVLVIASLEAISALGKVFVKVATDSKKKWQMVDFIILLNSKEKEANRAKQWRASTSITTWLQHQKANPSKQSGVSTSKKRSCNRFRCKVVARAK